jgi:hypothetical protein
MITTLVHGEETHLLRAHGEKKSVQEMIVQEMTDLARLKEISREKIDGGETSHLAPQEMIVGGETTGPVMTSLVTTGHGMTDGPEKIHKNKVFICSFSLTSLLLHYLGGSWRRDDSEKAKENPQENDTKGIDFKCM